MSSGFDSDEVFKLDLDTEDFLSKAKEAQESITAIGEVDNLSGLISGLAGAGAAVIAFGAVALTLKESLDLVFDAERINAVENQFDVLTEKAGLYSDKLLQGLQESSRGWVDDTTLMQAANKSLVELNVGADKLPDIMNAARQATAVMGGDLITNFNAMSQAVATGNTRLLRHMGIVIDQKKAYDDYAKSIGVSTESLSKAGQEQAVLNALLEQTKSKFAGQNEDIQTATHTWLELKASLADIYEYFVKLFNSFAGGAISEALKDITGAVKGFSLALKETTGSDMDKSAAGIKSLQYEITELDRKIQAAKEHKGFLNSILPESMVQTNIANLETLKQKYVSDMNAMIAAHKKLEQEQYGPSESLKAKEQPDVAAARSVDLEKQKEALKKFQKEAEQIDKELKAEELNSMDTVAEATRIYNEQRLAEVKKVDDQIKAARKVEADAAKQEVAAKAAGDKAWLAQAVQMHNAASAEIVQLNKLKDSKMQQDDQALMKMQEQALDNYLNKSQTVFDGVSRAFVSMSKKNQDALKDFGSQGTEVANTFGSHMTNCFQQIGSGAKSATDALSSAFLGMIADVAGHYGEMMMLASIFPFNPAVFAAGAALEMLSGLLGAVSGGGAQSVGNAGSLSTGTAGTPGTVNSPANPSPTTGSGTGVPQSSNGPANVQVIVQGHLFNDSSTSTWLTDQIRQASSATDFTIKTVNGGV